MNYFENNRFHQALAKFIMLGSLAVLGLAIVVFYPSLNKSNSGLNIKEEEQRILGVLSEYIGGASEMEIHPTSVKLSYLNNGGEENTLYIVEENEAIEIIDLSGNRFTVSTPEVRVSNLTFNEILGAEGKSKVQASFILDASNKKLINNSALKAIVFDSDILPTPGSQKVIGLSPGDFSRINNTIYFSSGGNVGISQPTPTERLHVNAGGIRIENSTPAEPPCDFAHRGTIWITQVAGVSDQFGVCIKQANNTYKWAYYTGL